MIALKAAFLSAIVLSACCAADGLALAKSWNDAAEVSMTRGEWEQARSLYLRSLPVLERALGPEDSSTVLTMGNLCSASSHLSSTLDAKPLCTKALRMREKTLGPNHPDVARSMSDLGVLYATEGDLVRAESLLRDALRIADALRNFPDSPALYNNLGFLYFRKKQYAMSAGLFERAIASVESTRGPDDPELVTMLNNLATVCLARHQSAAAEQRFRRAIAISERLRPAMMVACRTGSSCSTASSLRD
jgi:tetratricopeptide (TPR) repeat protein